MGIVHDRLTETAESIRARNQDFTKEELLDALVKMTQMRNAHQLAGADHFERLSKEVEYWRSQFIESTTPPNGGHPGALDGGDEVDGQLRMDAYYYGFDRTGCLPVDRILSAVATAGKMYHHTEDWMDGNEDGTPVDAIQQAANEAAKRFPASPVGVPMPGLMRLRIQVLTREKRYEGEVDLEQEFVVHDKGKVATLRMKELLADALEKVLKDQPE